MNWFATHAYLAEWAALLATLLTLLFQKKTKISRANTAIAFKKT